MVPQPGHQAFSSLPIGEPQSHQGPICVPGDSHTRAAVPQLITLAGKSLAMGRKVPLPAGEKEPS